MGNTQSCFIYRLKATSRPDDPPIHHLRNQNARHALGPSAFDAPYLKIRARPSCRCPRPDKQSGFSGKRMPALSGLTAPGEVDTGNQEIGEIQHEAQWV